MKVAALFSGGKDSTYAVYLAQQKGWNVKYLVSLFPKADDSYMFHVPNIHLTPMLAEAMGVDFVKKGTSGEKERELEDLRAALIDLDIDGVVTGAIASNYQRSRIEAICQDLDLNCHNPLWHTDQKRVLEDVVDAGFRVMFVGVYAEGLGMDWLGRELDADALLELEAIAQKYGINVSGEGGEYETLVVDGPNFSKRLEILESQVQWESMSGTLYVKETRLVDK
jgi:ABC transporter with metal-binding/Fe-S-binding domain ATP-binding protein